jgi:PadR family transcriptional regulator, regulatory protein PadR
MSVVDNSWHFFAPSFWSLNKIYLIPLTSDKSTRNSVVEPRGNMPPPTDLLQGTLDLLILKTLALERMHGWGIAQRIQQISKDALQIGQGSLYPALHRLEYKGWISADWGASDNNRKAKFYSITKAGRKQLVRDAAYWERLANVMGRVLAMESNGGKP